MKVPHPATSEGASSRCWGRGRQALDDRAGVGGCECCMCTCVMGVGGENYQLPGNLRTETVQTILLLGVEKQEPEVVKETGHFLPLPWVPPGLSLGIHCTVGGRRGNDGAGNGVQ